jgi:hypothetical protein
MTSSSKIFLEHSGMSLGQSGISLGQSNIAQVYFISVVLVRGGLLVRTGLR